MNEASLKICLIAGKKVGKKTFLRNHVHLFFHEDYMMMVGVEFATRKVDMYGIKISLSFWVISDEENRFKYLYRSFIAGSCGVILLYDITNQDSLTIFPNRIQMINDYSDENEIPIPILLVGNKLDLDAHREVSKEQVERFMEQHDIFSLMEISLKTGENVEHMITEITRMILTKRYPNVIK